MPRHTENTTVRAARHNTPCLNLNAVCRWFVAGLLLLSSLGPVLLLAHHQNLKLVLDGVASLRRSRFAHIHCSPPPPVRLAASGLCAGCFSLMVFVLNCPLLPTLASSTPNRPTFHPHQAPNLGLPYLSTSSKSTPSPHVCSETVIEDYSSNDS